MLKNLLADVFTAQTTETTLGITRQPPVPVDHTYYSETGGCNTGSPTPELQTFLREHPNLSFQDMMYSTMTM
jgi:hypothetical protein